VELIALVRRDAYTDSVALMRVSAELRALSGVVAAAAVMATDLNRAQLREAGLLTDEAGAAGARVGPRRTRRSSARRRCSPGAAVGRPPAA